MDTLENGCEYSSIWATIWWTRIFILPSFPSPHLLLLLLFLYFLPLPPPTFPSSSSPPPYSPSPSSSSQLVSGDHDLCQLWWWKLLVLLAQLMERSHGCRPHLPVVCVDNGRVCGVLIPEQEERHIPVPSLPDHPTLSHPNGTGAVPQQWWGWGQLHMDQSTASIILLFELSSAYIKRVIWEHLYWQLQLSSRHNALLSLQLRTVRNSRVLPYLHWEGQWL